MIMTKEKPKSKQFVTDSNISVKPVYYGSTKKPKKEEPGKYPFTRGIHPGMYRDRLWTMRQFAGYGTPEETNRRFKLLLDKGQTGLSVAYDMPTLMGYDPDHPYSAGEVGKCGVSVASLKDMERLFKDINLGDISVGRGF